MNEKTYLQWLSGTTQTLWWGDSGIPGDIKTALSHGAVGVTTNPVLTFRALNVNRQEWKNEIKDVLESTKDGNRAAALTGIVVKKASDLLLPIFKETRGKSGFVCSQVNPSDSSNREAMLDTALKMRGFNENVSVKLPATAAGLDVMEECVALGMNVTMTVSFTVPQVLSVAQRYREAKQKAERAGNIPGLCFAVIMIGRLDDYIRDVALDSKVPIEEKDIQCAGLSVVKRAYSIYRQEKYEAILMIAAMRGIYHITELAGSAMILSIHPTYQVPLLNNSVPKEELIDKPVDILSIKKLQTIPEFIKAYEPDGMKPEEFLSYGPEQRTLTQFSDVGWNQLEKFQL